MDINLREKLHQKIDQVSGEILKDNKQNIKDSIDKLVDILYNNSSDKDWQNLAIQSLWENEEEIEYTLADAKEVYRHSPPTSCSLAFKC
ncbi:MAG: hypothetical protein VKL20_04450 [Synechocystis sp.]|nr:hypothetical protein [Synechocystis sp.]